MTFAKFCARFVGRSSISLAVAVGCVPAFAYTPPTGCTDISHIPPVDNIEYAASIQGIFVEFSSNPKAGCADCHTTNGGVMPPSGELNLDPNDPDPAALNPYANIVNVPSFQVPSLDYIEPNHPERSYLFMKINCDHPPAGGRMPQQYLDVFTPEQQALIYDWIAGGATIEATNTIFRGTFEPRGFQQ